MRSSLLVGLGAGLTSALLFMAAPAGSLLGVISLLFLSPLPIAIAGLGWGWAPAAVAAAAAAAVLLFMPTPGPSISHLLAIGAPTAVLAHYVLLHRDAGVDGAGKPVLEWYPPGRVVLMCALWAGTLGVLATLLFGTDYESYAKAMTAMVERILTIQPNVTLPQEGVSVEQARGAFAQLMIAVFPSGIAALWMTLSTFNLWLAGAVVQRSGRLTRPWPDLSLIEMPRSTPLLFAASIAGTFLPDLWGLLASGFATAIMVAYMLVGLAILHHQTRGLSARGILLGLVYASLLVLSPFSAFIVAMIGLAEPFSPLNRWRGRPTGQGPGPGSSPPTG